MVEPVTNGDVIRVVDEKDVADQRMVFGTPRGVFDEVGANGATG